MREDHHAGKADSGRDHRLMAGATLRALRQARGISQDGWAARLGVGRRTVVRWELGETIPDAAMEEVIVDACQQLALFSGSLRGRPHEPVLSAELLRGLLAEARLATSGHVPPPDVPAPPRTPTRTGNLPAPLNRLIGREAVCAEVVQLVESSRLVTLTGTGGCGKTRLAIDVARYLQPRFAGGAWLVELAALSDPAAVAPTIAAILGVREQPGPPPELELVGHLLPQPVLLVVDNCEHLVTACAQLLDRLLRACPLLTVLATSRRPLAVTGEHVWRVPSLPSPNPAQFGDPAAVREYAAVQLFIERARAARAGFALTEGNATAVAQICCQLGGIPLAIELAAARTGVLMTEQIAARLGARFALLTTGAATALPRHQTLRALVDWSYDLLTDDERRLFERLAVFAGDFCLDEAVAICSDSGSPTSGESATLDLLDRLVGQSLVIAEDGRGSMRYWLLETLRAYADDRLQQRGECSAVRNRHRDHFVALAQQAEPALHGVGQAAWLARLSDARDNLRAALDWCEAKPEGVEPGLRLAGSLWRYWAGQGQRAEGFARLQRLLARPGVAPPAVEAKALLGAGALARYQGDPESEDRYLRRCLGLARAAGDNATESRALTNLGVAAMYRGDYATASALIGDGLVLRRASADQWGVANSLHNLGYLAHRRGDLDQAGRWYEESLSLAGSLDDQQSVAITTNNLAGVRREQGDFVAARHLLLQGLELRRQLGDEVGAAHALHSLGELFCLEGKQADARRCFTDSLRVAVTSGSRRLIAECFEGLAAVAAEEGQARHAATLLGAAAALREAIDAAREAGEERNHALLVERLTADLSRGQFDAAIARGRLMSLDQAIEQALAKQ